MDPIAVGLAVAGLVVILGTWIRYLSTIPSGNVPARPLGSIILQCVGIVLGLSAIGWSYRSDGGFHIEVFIPAAIAMMMGAFFLWLLTQRKTPIGDLKVEVGDRLLPFAATTSEGAAFHTDELTGKRTLLKFFRGGW